MNSRNLNAKRSLALAIGVMAALNVNSALSQSTSIQNPGFESSFSGWDEIDSASVSSVERSGSRSAKISGNSGKLS